MHIALLLLSLTNLAGILFLIHDVLLLTWRVEEATVTPEHQQHRRRFLARRRL